MTTASASDVAAQWWASRSRGQRATLLSAVLPGSGSIYLGRPRGLLFVALWAFAVYLAFAAILLLPAAIWVWVKSMKDVQAGLGRPQVRATGSHRL